MDVYQVKDTPQNDEVVTISYTRPRLFHRLLANLVDIFIMLILFLGLFIGTRAIVQNTDQYKTKLLDNEYYSRNLVYTSRIPGMTSVVTLLTSFIISILINPFMEKNLMENLQVVVSRLVEMVYA